jgi:NAD(P)-dependent dehydrogenase (short-subunit alcohol dehydrogenase family)
MAIEAGARVVVADLRLSEALAATIGASNEHAKFVHTDVRKRGDLETAIGFSLQIFGDVPDIYVANAGVFEPVSDRQARIYQSAKADKSPKQWSNFWLDTEGDSYATAEISEQDSRNRRQLDS